MIFISVIVPNYNHEQFLKERIESILNQSYPHFELLLMDDASTDNSRAILEQYRGHEKVKGIYYNTANSGSPFGQWYEGINKAGHDWIWIAESDDSSDPLFLEKCVEQIKNNPTASMVMTQSNWIDAEGKTWFQRQTTFETEGLKSGRTVLKDYLLYGNPVKNASAVLFNKKSLDPAEVRKIVNYRWCGDWALWNHLTSAGDLYFINQPLNHFRRHEQASSNELYYKGYLYKEGLQLSLAYQNKIKAGTGLRWKAFYHWTHHLLNQYGVNLKSGRSRLYLFSPLYYCVLMHFFLPVIGIGGFIKKRFGRKNRNQSNS